MTSFLHLAIVPMMAMVVPTQSSVLVAQLMLTLVLMLTPLSR